MVRLEGGSFAARLGAAVAIFITCAGAPSLEASAAAPRAFVPARGSTTFSGRAKVVTGKVAGVPITVCDTGELGSSGGAVDSSLLKVNVVGLVNASGGHATSVGQGEQTRSEAGITRVEMTCLGTDIGVEFVFSRAVAECVNGKPVLSGWAEVSCVAIDGTPYDITGGTNETICIPGGKIVINEQFKTIQGASGELTVNGIHVTCGFGLSLVDVTIASTTAGIVCGSIDCDGGDFVTGAGTIDVGGGATACFGVAGGRKEGGGLWGHLVFDDRSSGGPDVSSTSVTKYVVVNATKRKIEGACKINGKTGFRYVVTLEDKSDDGSKDTFMLDLSNGYWAMGTLLEGDLQIHVPCE